MRRPVQNRVPPDRRAHPAAVRLAHPRWRPKAGALPTPDRKEGATLEASFFRHDLGRSAPDSYSSDYISFRGQDSGFRIQEPTPANQRPAEVNRSIAPSSLSCFRLLVSDLATPEPPNPDSLLGVQQDLAEEVSAFHLLLGGGRLAQRKRRVDYSLQLPLPDEFERLRELALAAHERSENGALPAEERLHVQGHHRP